MVRHCILLLVHASVKPGCVARRLLCHKVNLPSCVARWPLCHKVNLSRLTEMWSSAAIFHVSLWLVIFSAPDTAADKRNNFSPFVIYSEKLINQPTVAPRNESLKSTHSTRSVLRKLLMWAHQFHWRLWWFPWNVWEV